MSGLHPLAGDLPGTGTGSRAVMDSEMASIEHRIVSKFGGQVCSNSVMQIVCPVSFPPLANIFSSSFRVGSAHLPTPPPSPGPVLGIVGFPWENGKVRARGKGYDCTL